VRGAARSSTRYDDGWRSGGAGGFALPAPLGYQETEAPLPPLHVIASPAGAQFIV
jgi:hypothetical protein